jgi:hypothetical protein
VRSLQRKLRIAKNIILVTIALTVLSLITPHCTTYAEDSATIQVIPSTATVVTRTTFTLDVTIADVVDLAVWEFRLFYLSTILNCINISEGPFLKAGGSTFFDSTIDNAYNDTHGWLSVGSTLLGQVPGVNGTGTLATITFQAVAAGDSPLQFSDDPLVTFILDSSPPPRHSIPFTTLDGTVTVTRIQDVAVLNVTSYKTIIGQNHSGEVTVTIENQGNYTETCNVTAYANSSLIETVSNITLASLESIALTLTWNTIGFHKGNFTVYAYVSPLPFEADTLDNNYTSPVAIMVGMPGDVVSPFGVIDMKDVAYVAKRFGTTPGASLWDPNADIDGTRKADMRDIATVARGFGNRDP